MKFYEICLNARDNGMLDDPRVAFDSEANLLNLDCGFSLRGELVSADSPNFPNVCGNCKWYSVQNDIKKE